MLHISTKMLHISTKMLGLPPKITKLLDNAHHPEAFSYLFQREKKTRLSCIKSNNVFMVLMQKNKIVL